MPALTEDISDQYSSAMGVKGSFDSNDQNADELFGDGGRETSGADENDILSSIESRT